MYTLIAQNKYGQQIELTHNEAYVIESIEGIDPPEAVINVVKNANADGSVFNSAYVNERQIIITLAINGPAEDNRINLYKYFKNKYPTRLYYKNGTRDVYIDGYCKNIQISFFNLKQIAQIIIICPDPFFKNSDNELINFSSIDPLFEFPFEIEEPIAFSEILADVQKNIINKGDVDAGMKLVINITGSVTNPIIYNSETNQYFKLNASFISGDEIVIDTEFMKKSVALTRNGAITSLVNVIQSGSTWMQLLPGDNLLTMSADSGSEYLSAYILVSDLYEGV